MCIRSKMSIFINHFIIYFIHTSNLHKIQVIFFILTEILRFPLLQMVERMLVQSVKHS